MRRICVFCGSRPGAREEYLEAARELGKTLARRNLTLVYGGMKIGLMGEIADSVIRHGGEVIGVIPQLMTDQDMGHGGITDLRVVQSMHERKAVMADLSDAFVVLPGGVGTLEEFFEIWSWASLKLHHKPCGVLNVQNYYDPMLRFFDQAVSEGFLKKAIRSLVIVEEDGEKLIDRLSRFTLGAGT